MEELESRFLHLLQPIRDLTKNWEVDVAAQLGEYLEELDQICISFDNGRTIMNFVEAALVIQGSVSIYSKKVEHLYQLVYQTLDFICNKKRQKQPCSVGADGKDIDATFGTEQEEEFLSLDDIGDSTEASVDLRRDQQPSTVELMPLTPMCLVPPDDAEKRSNPLLSCKGELLASRRDFRINTCTPHASGAFLLEPYGLSPACRLQGTGGGLFLGGAWGWGLVTGGPGDVREQLGAAVQALDFSEGAGEHAAGPDNDDIRDDIGPEDAMEVPPAVTQHVEAQKSLPQPKGYALRVPVPAQDPKTHLKEKLDPWQSLDPFADSEDKPFKKGGRPFVLPPSLKDVAGGKRKRKGPRKLQDFIKWFSATYYDGSDGRRTKRKGPTFADLEAFYWKEQKERMAVWKKLQHSLGMSPLLSLVTLCLPTAPACDVSYEELVRRNVVGTILGLEEAAGQAWGVDSRGFGGAAGGSGVSPSWSPLSSPTPSPQELFITNSQKYLQETELSQNLRSWEDRIGPLLQEQARHNKPHCWQAAGEERPTFDIHSYGVALAEKCQPSGQWHFFASLMCGLPPFEVSRYLLAALQLVS
ncbi:CNDH2 protein, partial [Ramphastos sulfuratus]|nr:CNDH2 protein [Ramphastos sulfuratus]